MNVTRLYTKISTAIRFAQDRGEIPGSTIAQINRNAYGRSIAKVFKADNPDFDEERFLKGCGVVETEHA